jgi:hypothetical protein
MERIDGGLSQSGADATSNPAEMGRV